MKPSYLAELRAHRYTFLYLVRIYLLLRYQRTALGFLWTLLNPLLTMTVTAVVFSMVLRIEMRAYAIFLLAGSIPWLCFSNTVLQSVGIFINNEGLIKKVYVPKLIFPAALATSALLDSVLSACALLLIVIVLGAQLSVHLLFLPVAFVLLYLFASSVGLLISVATVYFRDLQYVATHLLQLAYFLTPVLYPLDLIPPKFHGLYALNPMVPFVELFRAPIYRNQLPDAAVIASACVIGVATLAVALTVFRRYEDRLVFRL
ncbi:MAG: hypothetical protein A3F77_11365 [Betaproteobacteria bacterium RIFCSPLOWO2_12_FULL_67_28]|nr:MAG: hypothetical protein A3I65_00410 [Betaproteobacteria bacterium RIFCSPLOWO2_02_FULL_68_150]OGA68255.1 MAG: hypothetical protein A3F77_11365 [Betaproteobacteria bacterium RIFCSPLOWO2_12_FULL_67_28]